MNSTRYVQLVCGGCGNRVLHFPERPRPFRICFRCGDRIPLPPWQHAC